MPPRERRIPEHYRFTPKEESMRIHTDNLTARSIYEAAGKAGVFCDLVSCGSRKRDHAFDVRLSAYGRDDLHRYSTNSGKYGAGDEVAATWDEWGVFIAALFTQEPTAIIGQYDGDEEFRRFTGREQSRVAAQYAEDSVYSRTHTAPWLEDVA